MRSSKLAIAALAIAFVPAVANASVSDKLDRLQEYLTKELKLLKQFRAGKLDQDKFTQKFAKVDVKLDKLQQKIDDHASN